MSTIENYPQNHPESAQNSLAPTPPDSSASSAITAQKGIGPDIMKPAPNPQEMMDALVAFLRQYLVCDDHQLTILALWIVHTWCYHLFQTAAYLNLRSPQPESGKTLCLQLINILCRSPWSATGPTPATIVDTLLHKRTADHIKKDGFGEPHSILLDDCHHIFGPSERQQLLAMLNSGCRRLPCYILGYDGYALFRPMAFAGNSPLPRSLAARCIHIVLKRKKPSDVAARFHFVAATDEAGRIFKWLQSVEKDPSWIDEKIREGPPKLPSRVLTAHEQDCAEPLFYIADAIGGSWPKRARAAIVTCSKQIESDPSIQVLSDIRTWLFLKKDPEYIASRDLLPLLGRMDYRPWAGWNHLSGKRLGKLLRAFGIISRRFTAGKDKFQGYVVKDFHDAWERYLQPFPTQEDLADRDRILANGGGPE